MNRSRVVSGIRVAGVLLVLALPAGCGGAETNAARPDPARAALPAGDDAVRLPVSLNEVMVALVNHAANPIWLAGWRNPQSEDDWRELAHDASQLRLAGALLVIPGNGPMDAVWTANPQWRVWAGKLEAAGNLAAQAIAARDRERISHVGDEIVDVCEGCHLAFKPDLPTSGLFGELAPTAADFERKPTP